MDLYIYLLIYLFAYLSVYELTTSLCL